MQLTQIYEISKRKNFRNLRLMKYTTSWLDHSLLHDISNSLLHAISNSLLQYTKVITTSWINEVAMLTFKIYHSGQPHYQWFRLPYNAHKTLTLWLPSKICRNCHLVPHKFFRFSSLVQDKIFGFSLLVPDKIWSSTFPPTTDRMILFSE